jgi:MFS family permease
VPFAILATLLLRLAASAAGASLQLDLADRARAGGDVTAATLALVGAAFFVVELLGSPLLGARADRAGYRRYMLLGPLAGAAASLVLNLPATIGVWLLARAGQGVSTAASVPATLSFVSAATEHNRTARSRGMAFFEVATAVGLAGGLAVGGQLWGRFHELTYVVLLVPYVLAFGLFLLVREPARPAVQAPEPSLRDRIELMRQPRVLAFVPAWLAVNAIVGAWGTHAAFQMARRRLEDQYLMSSLSPGGIGLAMGGYGAVFLVGLVLWAWLLPRVGIGRTLWISLAGMVAAVAAIWAINHDPSARPEALAALVVAVIVEAGFVPAALVRLAEISETPAQGGASSRGLVMGTYSLVLGLGQLLGGGIAAPFAQRGGIDGLLMATALLIAFAASALLVGERVRLEPSAYTAAPRLEEGLDG